MKLKSIVFLFVALSLQLAWAAPAETDEAEARKAEARALATRLKYQQGEIHLEKDLATLKLPETFRYLDPAGAQTLLSRIWGNPPSDDILGVIVPAGFDPFADESWCVVVSYQEDGYVKDDDAAEINYTKLLKDMQKDTRADSKQRVKEGYGAIELVGWAATPRYDKATHKFYWAKELKFEGSDENTLNYNLRILGRRGILVLNAVANMSQLGDIEKATPEILAMVDFNEGHRYADYKPGSDKVASYGLAAIVAGGLAAKTGLFKGLIAAIIALKKFVIIGVLAIFAGIQKLFAWKKRQGGA
jgi:uncharacterized membrane-anchored protein